MSIQPIGASTSAYVPPQAGAVRQAEGQSDTLKAEAAKAEAAKAAANASGVQGSSAVQNPNQPNTTAKPTREELDHAVKQIQDVVKPSAQNLQISIDEDVNMTVVKVVDGESKKVIRQIPSEEVVEIAKALDKLQGLFVKQQA